MQVEGKVKKDNHGLVLLVWTMVVFLTLSYIGILVEEYFGFNRIQTPIYMAYVDLIEPRGPECDELEQNARDRSNREAMERRDSGNASGRDNEKAREWEIEHYS